MGLYKASILSHQGLMKPTGTLLVSARQQLRVPALAQPEDLINPGTQTIVVAPRLPDHTDSIGLHLLVLFFSNPRLTDEHLAVGRHLTQLLENALTQLLFQLNDQPRIFNNRVEAGGELMQARIPALAGCKENSPLPVPALCYDRRVKAAGNPEPIKKQVGIDTCSRRKAGIALNGNPPSPAPVLYKHRPQANRDSLLCGFRPFSPRSIPGKLERPCYL